MEKTKRQNEVINDDEPMKYRKYFMRIKFESDDDLPLGETFSISDMIIAAVSVLKKILNIIHKLFYMNVHISYKNAAIRKN